MTRDPAPWRWWIHLLLIAGYPVVVGLLSAGDRHSVRPALGSTSSGLLFVVLIEISLFSLVVFVAWLFSRFSAAQLLLTWKGSWQPIACGLGYSIALRAILALVVASIAGIAIAAGTVSQDQLRQFLNANRPDVTAVVDADALRNNPWYMLLSLTLVSFVLGGLREELWRAAFLAGALAIWPLRTRTRFGQFLVICIAAICFGLGHILQGPLAVALTGLLGVGLGLIMVLHRSIWPAVMAHGFFNATSFAILPWALQNLPHIKHL